MSAHALVDIWPFIAGGFRDGDTIETVNDKFTGQPATRVALPSRQQVGEAIGAVVAAQRTIQWDPPDRYRVLARAAELLRARAEDIASTIVVDSGFTLADARREVSRATETLLLSGEEAKRLAGEVIPLSGADGQEGRIGFTVYHPLGVVCAITPFNSPLNTVCHKVAPALAAGNGVVLKPASQTPRTANCLVRLLLEAGVPPDLLSVVYGGGGTVGKWLTEDPRPGFYAFTGSTEVGAEIHRTVGLRRNQLELGSLSSTIICADARLEPCIVATANAAFRKAGQVCTSVQRLYVERSILGDVTGALAERLEHLRVGDPSAPHVSVGPLIAPEEADRVTSWVDQAIQGGAQLVTGGSRTGNVLEPTVLSDVDAEMKVMRREVFGPVVVLRPFEDLDRAIYEVNDTPYGLAAGIFTRDLDRALTAASRLRMGSIHVNETSSSRVDLMPYTGVKASGLGREGPRYAVREMSEERLVTLGAM